MKLIAKFEQPIQVSENEYRVVWRERLIDSNTKMSEIINWAKSYTKDYVPAILISLPD